MHVKKRILVVDDEELVREVIVDLLETFDYECESASDGIEALAKAKLSIDLIMTDLMMPKMDGFEVIRRLRNEPESRDLPIIVVTAMTSREDRLKAIEIGANDFIAKPIDNAEVQVRVASLMRMKEIQDAIKRHKEELEKIVQQRTEVLRKTLDQMVDAQRRTHEAYLDTIKKLAIAAEYKDEGTAEHIYRISYYCVAIARALKLSPHEIEVIQHASPMHDVGKIGIPDGILLKPGQLDKEEWDIMQQHTIIGARILCGSSSELLQAGEIIAKSHHEKWDGTGYPGGIKGDAIPLFGRIVSIVDVFDALTTKRPYKKAFSNEEAFEILKDGRGKHFDPQIVDLFFAIINEILAIQKQYIDHPKPAEPLDIDRIRY
ncbi:MAG: HD domain-containing phosphohydrolase [Candidatus Neomarinimicrobiota bacterium]